MLTLAPHPARSRPIHRNTPRLDTEHSWHYLAWEYAPALDKPFSSEALTYARRLAAGTQRFPDTAAALIRLLERWGAGLTDSAAERRMAVRLSQQRLRLLDGVPPTSTGAVIRPAPQQIAAISGEADEDADLDAWPSGEDDFYADVMDSG